MNTPALIKYNYINKVVIFYLFAYK